MLVKQEEGFAFGPFYSSARLFTHNLLLSLPETQSTDDTAKAGKLYKLNSS